MGTVRAPGTPLVVLALGVFAAGLLLSGGRCGDAPVIAMGVATLVGLGLRPAVVRLRRRLPRLPRALAALLVLPAGLLLAAVVTAAALPGWPPDTLPGWYPDALPGGYPGHPARPTWWDALRGARPPEHGYFAHTPPARPGTTTSLAFSVEERLTPHWSPSVDPPQDDSAAAVGAGVVAFAPLLWAYALLVDGPRLLRRAAVGSRGRRATRAAVRVCARLVSRQAVLAAAAGAGGYALADTLRVDGAARLGVLVAVAALVPRYGLAIGGAIVALAAFAASREAGLVATVVAVAVQQVVSRALASRDVGRRQALAALGGGVLGLLLAGPAGAACGVPVGWTAAAAGGARRGAATPHR